MSTLSKSSFLSTSAEKNHSPFPSSQAEIEKKNIFPSIFSDIAETLKK